MIYEELCFMYIFLTRVVSYLFVWAHALMGENRVLKSGSCDIYEVELLKEGKKLNDKSPLTLNFVWGEEVNFEGDTNGGRVTLTLSGGTRKQGGAIIIYSSNDHVSPIIKFSEHVWFKNHTFFFSNYKYHFIFSF